MNDNINNSIIEKLEARNKLGKMKLEETKLEYKKQILVCLREMPEMLDLVGQQMNIPKEEIINKLSSDEANISFLDQTLVLVKKREEHPKNNGR